MSLTIKEVSHSLPAIRFFFAKKRFTEDLASIFNRDSQMNFKIFEEKLY